jgi:hypothetical protein
VRQFVIEREVRGASTLSHIQIRRMSILSLELLTEIVQEVATSAGLNRLRRATETPFNIVYEARP